VIVVEMGLSVLGLASFGEPASERSLLADCPLPDEWPPPADEWLLLVDEPPVLLELQATRSPDRVVPRIIIVFFIATPRLARSARVELCPAFEEERAIARERSVSGLPDHPPPRPSRTVRLA
jgi:hypothetical protein